MSNGTIHVPPPTTWEGYQGHELDDVIQILPQEWSRVARCHFGEELGRYYHDPENDPEKPEVYATMGGGGPENSSSWTVCNVPLYQHRYSDNYPPPYDWVQASELLLPVKIDGSWSALYAAQRELNRLRDVDAYVSNRLRKLERDLPEAMDEKMKEAPWLDVRYVWAQRRGMLHAVGLGDYEQSQEHIDWEREGCPGPPPDGAKDTKWVWDVDKMFFFLCNAAVSSSNAPGGLCCDLAATASASSDSDGAWLGFGGRRQVERLEEVDAGAIQLISSANMNSTFTALIPASPTPSPLIIIITNPSTGSAGCGVGHRVRRQQRKQQQQQQQCTFGAGVSAFAPSSASPRYATIPPLSGSWPALYAAQRELSKLRDRNAYIRSRLRMLGREISEAMDKKLQEDPLLDVRYVWAQRQGMLQAVGLEYQPSEEQMEWERGVWERQGRKGPRPDRDRERDMIGVWDVDKTAILRFPRFLFTH
ncbi:hypothetical protein B0T21DRAFT_344529 [Apiosordaria backusii]|uniref:Uncharacterized protein n=1 Tax=Apiosordaria backusii TaxID=314023 RepID=A0AA40ERQ1_9PEZI|nr:hypothetical protein B0T21DRAFT_344529 [Apiosordaria backusii]